MEKVKIKKAKKVNPFDLLAKFVLIKNQSFKDHRPVYYVKSIVNIDNGIYEIVHMIPNKRYDIIETMLGDYGKFINEESYNTIYEIITRTSRTYGYFDEPDIYGYYRSCFDYGESYLYSANMLIEVEQYSKDMGLQERGK